MRLNPSKTPAIFAAAISAASCAPNSKTTSHLEYAYGAAPQILGSPAARIEIRKMGFATNLTELKICVEGGNKAITDRQLLTESELVHVMWMKTAGYTAQDYSLLHFQIAAKCRKSDNAFASAIVLGSFDREEPGDNLKKDFGEPIIECQSNENSFSCGSHSTTLGLGGPGGTQHSYFSATPNAWTRIDAASPASVVLSPYVDWLSLDDDLQGNTTISEKARQDLRGSYAKLLATEDPTYEDLSNFADKLQSIQLILSGDAQFKSLMNDFVASNKISLTQPYRIRQSAFQVLLHEVGHTFGMEHADNPDGDSVTGTSATTSKGSNGQWTTKESTMAYGKPFAYLTDDDQAGIKAATAAIKAELSTHK